MKNQPKLLKVSKLGLDDETLPVIKSNKAPRKVENASTHA
jgi:hypothetical protein